MRESVDNQVSAKPYESANDGDDEVEAFSGCLVIVTFRSTE